MRFSPTPDRALQIVSLDAPLLSWITATQGPFDGHSLANVLNESITAVAFNVHNNVRYWHEAGRYCSQLWPHTDLSKFAHLSPAILYPHKDIRPLNDIGSLTSPTWPPSPRSVETCAPCHPYIYWPADCWLLTEMLSCLFFLQWTPLHLSNQNTETFCVTPQRKLKSQPKTM